MSLDPLADDSALVARVHELHQVISASQRELLSCLAQLESHETWLDDGAHDMAHWVSMQLGVSRWKAERWVSAGRGLNELRRVASSFAKGELGMDKVVELTRFATADDEEALVDWAQNVAPGAIRRRGDELRRAERTEVEQIEEDRWLAWRWTDEGRRLLLEAELSAAQGSVVTDALDRLANEIPTMPGEESHLLIRTVIESADGSVIGLGRAAREPSSWMMRQLRHRDRTCTFPGCGNRRFAHAHHIRWWSRGGRTDLDNLALVCTFHHRLVHEHGWNLERANDGEVRWFRPGGVRYRAGPLAA